MAATDGGTSSMSFGNSVTVERSFSTGLKEVAVPFAVKTTLGLE